MIKGISVSLGTNNENITHTIPAQKLRSALS